MHFVSSNFINLLDFPNPNLDNLTAVARSEMSAHRISIEMGSHVRPKICKEDRICKNCDLEEVEDESHYLFKMPSVLPIANNSNDDYPAKYHY